jgi:hypothetical protein
MVSGYRHAPVHPGTHWIGGWVSPRSRSGRGGEDKKRSHCPCRESNFSSAVLSLVTILIELPAYIYSSLQEVSYRFRTQTFVAVTTKVRHRTSSIILIRTVFPLTLVFQPKYCNCFRNAYYMAYPSNIIEAMTF